MMVLNSPAISQPGNQSVRFPRGIHQPTRSAIIRKEVGEQPVTAALKAALVVQYAGHKSWSYQLHTDNLAALIEACHRQTRRAPRSAESTALQQRPAPIALCE
jgi:hypothetical protein